MELSSTLSLTLFVSLTVALGILWMCDATVQVERPRGVSLSNEPLYNKDAQGEWFTCLDGSMKIPRSQLNDDYCDCPDYSDEPGTSACPDGRFHCNNRGYKPMYIPSSRVNDGICDCCDASDEYEGPGAGRCINNCKELGKKDLEERRQQILLSNQGFEIRQEYIKAGQAKKAEREESLKKLQAERDESSAIVDTKQKLKEAAETPETEAKDRHQKAWEAEVAAKKAAEEKERASQAFKELDVNSDGQISLSEIQSRKEFDENDSGDVNEEEAKNTLGGSTAVDEAAFTENVWNNIKDRFKSASQLAAEQAEGVQRSETTDEPAAFDTFADEDDEDDIDEYDEEEEDEWADEDDDDRDDLVEHDVDEDAEEEMRKLSRERRLDRLAKRREEREKRKAAEDKMPEYDEETKALIATADEARKEYDDANDKLKNIDRSISDIEKQLRVDLGPEQEFQEMQGKCFEFTDREYVYKLCPFEKSSQKPKHGGSETSLGTWNQWEGPADNKYSVMMYTRGQKCWNGPDRSTKVLLKCGIENKITSASEPDRCVYQFELITPALCTYKYDINTGEADTHDEL
ncbi:glucosidase 2 subunit beta-like [Diadema antillarum]|uniref:glucosidase 2 subunit beta-like n=1 Tax=Diadema antillarum TaxID=105358 RepID=UPI003A8AD212